MKHRIKICPSQVEFLSETNLLDDALSQSVTLEYSCKTGDCNTCSAYLVSGTVINEVGEQVSKGSILTCQSRPLSDCVLEANYYPELSELSVKTLPCKVDSIEKTTDDILVLSVRFPPNAEFAYLSGQYIDLVFNGVKRSYSIANAPSAPKKNNLELHIRNVPEGKMSRLLFDQAKPNQLMSFEGPKGTFFIRDSAKPLILIATGTGIAPIKAMIEKLVAENDQRQVFIYWGMRYKAELYCSEFLDFVNKTNNMRIKPVLSRETDWGGVKGYVQEAVLDDFDGLDGYQVYACGSIEMIASAKDMFINRGLLEEDFFSDAFTAAKD